MCPLKIGRWEWIKVNTDVMMKKIGAKFEEPKEMLQ